MGELRGSYRVHFVLAMVLCGLELLCMASTWLPGKYTVPAWLVMGLFGTVFPVFVVALFRGAGGARLMGGANADRFARYVRVLPPALKLTYAVIICLAALGIATGANAAEDAQADASGYYYTYWDRSVNPQRNARVDLTEAEYYAALKAQRRIFTAGPALFYAASSFLVLASASAAAAARTQTTPEDSSGAATPPRPS
ncbi:hypothetical protein ACIF70_39515 [Actinacidiphila glaucinigra]|uniref:hypothetical protein n=1 Tax=Actinacidiphila glaucinigra TaxID=235986 RepID=UPI0037C81E31